MEVDIQDIHDHWGARCVLALSALSSLAEPSYCEMTALTLNFNQGENWNVKAGVLTAQLWVTCPCPELRHMVTPGCEERRNVRFFCHVTMCQATNWNVYWRKRERVDMREKPTVYSSSGWGHFLLCLYAERFSVKYQII